jgi:hypothetical protein
MLADAQCAACSTVAALGRTPKAFRTAFPPVGLPASTLAAGAEAHRGGQGNGRSLRTFRPEEQGRRRGCHG